MPSIVLASVSPRRSSLLREWGIPFRIVPPEGVDEEAVTGEAGDVARELALQKALAALAGIAGEDALVVGADTVVTVDGEILGKPRDAADARRMLGMLAGRSHRVITGVAVARAGRPAAVEAESSEVLFRPLAPAEIDAYIATGDPEGKAGAYGIQSGGGNLVAGFRGCYLNIVGLPVRRLVAMLRDAGAALPGSPADCACRGHPLWRGGEGCR